MGAAERGPVDFFVSHAGQDQAWAEWLAWQLTEAGYAVELDVWDWAPGQDFVARMQAALSTSGRLLAVWSAAYFQSVFGTAELRAAFVQQAREAGRVVPVMVERVAVPELFASLIYVDLVGLDEVAAAAWLRARLAGGRPKVAPRFPAAVAPSGDRPAFAGAWPAVWTAPPRNPHFVGRATMLSELRQRLRSEGHMLVVQSLYGLGGVGKTQLAIEYVHRFAADYTLVWWLDAEQPILVGGQLAALAARLGLSDGGLTEQTVRNVMDMLRRRQDWLLIFDNAQRPQDVTPYLPGGTGHILITSRQPGFGALGGRMEVDVLQRPETVALLRRRLPELDDQLAHELAAELGDLPLAAAQAAGYLESTGLPATDYLARFRGHRDSVLARGEVLGYQGRLDTTWKLSLERLNVDSPAAVALLRLAAFLAPEPFPVQVLNEHSEVLADPLRTAAADPDELDDVVGRIVGFSLARREGDNLHLHRLVQAAIRHDLTPEVRRQEQQRALSLLGVAHPGNPLDPTTWPRYRQLAAHILLTAPLSDDRADNRRLLCDTARYLQATGNFPASRAMTEELLSRWQAAPLLGPDDPDTLEAAAILACTHVSVGDDVRAAYGLSSATVERAGRVLGPDHPTTAWAAATWIIARLRMGERFPSAGRAPAGDQPREDALEHDLASLLEKGREAVSRARQVLGPDHWVTLWTATGLTIVRAYVGDREAQETARRLGQETMVRARQVLGPDHWVTLYTAAALTLALIRLGEAREACRLGQDTVDRARQGLGHDHPVTLYVAGLLTLALVEVGGRSELETARQLGEDTVDRARRVLDPGNSTDLWAAAGLALARARLGDPKPTVRTHDVLPGGRWALPTKSVETIVEGTDACSRPASALPIAAYMLIAAQGAARGTATTGSTVVEDAGTSLPDDHPAREFVRAVLSWPGDR